MFFCARKKCLNIEVSTLLCRAQSGDETKGALVVEMYRDVLIEGFQCIPVVFSFSAV